MTSPSTRRAAKRVVPIAVVAVVVLTIALTGLAGFDQPRLAVSFNAYFPSPTSYTPGVDQPNTLLEMNYTGSGTGYYYYLVTYNSSSGTQIAGRGSVSLPSGGSSSIFLQIPINPTTTVVAHAKIYQGTDESGKAVYVGTLEL